MYFCQLGHSSPLRHAPLQRESNGNGPARTVKSVELSRLFCINPNTHPMPGIALNERVLWPGLMHSRQRRICFRHSPVTCCQKSLLTFSFGLPERDGGTGSLPNAVHTGDRQNRSPVERRADKRKSTLLTTTVAFRIARPSLILFMPVSEDSTRNQN